MEQYCAILFDSLQNNIGACKNSKLTCKQKVEACFGLAVTHWMKLSKQLRHHHFASDEREIQFFKSLKPTITAEIEYYNFVYHSLLFQPEDRSSLFRFWRIEHERLERFKAANQAFIRCYEDDEIKMQSYFFLHKNYQLETVTNVRIYDVDSSLSTNGDWLVATLLALERYKSYAEKKIKSF